MADVDIVTNVALQQHSLLHAEPVLNASHRSINVRLIHFTHICFKLLLAACSQATITTTHLLLRVHRIMIPLIIVTLCEHLCIVRRSFSFNITIELLLLHHRLSQVYLIRQVGRSIHRLTSNSLQYFGRLLSIISLLEYTAIVISVRITLISSSRDKQLVTAFLIFKIRNRSFFMHMMMFWQFVIQCLQRVHLLVSGNLLL